MKGKFVTFEGCEGVGKSTQLRLLTEYLDASGVDYVLTREPGGTPVSERVRELLLDKTVEMDALTEAYLFAAARAEHVKQVIIPALEAGKLVICDRFLDSSVAYQGSGRGLGAELVEKINEYAMQGLEIDATIFLNLDPAHMWRASFGDDRIEKAGLDFHQRVYAGFLKQLEKYDRIISVVPEQEKKATAAKIVDALRKKGIIE